MKTLQKDLAEARAENKTLKQYDPARMKKNLDANKKKLAAETSANALLQKSLNRTKTENAELERKVEELEAQLAAQQPDAEDTAEPETEEAGGLTPTAPGIRPLENAQTPAAAG